MAVLAAGWVGAVSVASTLGFGQLRQLWLQAGGDPAWADRMANIALRESRGNPGAQNLKYPDHSIGLWQINQLAHKGRYGNDQQLMNPLANARAAVAVFKAQGPTAWSTYNPAIDKQYLGSTTGGRVSGGKTVKTTMVRTPGVDNSGLRRDLISQFILSGGPSNDSALIGLATGLQSAQDVPGSTKVKRAATTGGSTTAPGASTSATGTVMFDGKPVAAWIAPALKYARQKGWTGTVTSGYRSDAQQTAIYKSGVRPAAVPQSMGGHGSNHEFTAYPGGAVDVSNPTQLAQILARSPWGQKLLPAGAKDPPHFSHPHGGGY